jgi:hypothetical protein
MPVLSSAGLHRGATGLFILIILFLSPAGARAQDPAGPPSGSTPSDSPWYQQISVNGLVSTSISFNFNKPDSRTNQFRVFDVDDDSFTFDVLELVIQKDASAPGQAGFRVDALAGSGVPHVSASAGLFRDANGKGEDFDLRQAFFSYVAPAGRGLRFDVGKFSTAVGYEVIGGYENYNDNVSRSLLFGFAEPFAHTGVRLTYPFSDRVSAVFMVANGWDNVRDNNRGKTVGAQLALTPGDRGSVSVSYIGGPEQDNASPMRHLLDLVGAWSPDGTWTFAVNYDRGAEARVPLAGTAGGGVADVTWQGIAGYARVNLTARFFVTGRAEWFDDPQGARTGYRQTLTEVTVTPSFRVRPNLVVRGDLRRDHSNRDVFEKEDGRLGRSQVTASLNGIFVF